MYKKTFFLLAILFSEQSMAVAVSSLFEVADKGTHVADIQIANDDNQDMFINMEMVRVHYSNDGKKIVEQLNKSNVNDWTFSVSPSQMILKPGERKSVRMFNRCKDACNFTKDQIYAVDITPVPYSEGKKTAVAVAFGYRTYFLDPVKLENVKIDYDLKRISKNKFSFENNSNTMLNAVLNTCTRDYTSDCIIEHRLLPNSKHEYFFPKGHDDGSKQTFSIINANEEVNEQVTL
ncbi:fimbrial biogenesis chaperone [Vibrio campbellii]|uniref:pilus assembly protein n=1 Tax=Vibrio campbellii TaxID=680 RepID=UPI0038CD8C9D